MEATRAITIICAVIAGCGPSSEGEGVRVLNRTPRTGFWTAPFPSDDLRREDGTIDLGKFPNPDRLDLITQGLAMIEENAHGFATSGAIYFPLDGPIKTLPEATLVPLEGGAPHPIDVHFYEDARPYGPLNLLAILPVQGVPLKPNTTYVATVLGAQTIFTTGDPTKDFAEKIRLASHGSTFEGDFTLREVHDEFCVYSSTISMPILFQHATDATTERARAFVTLPRSPMAESGYPVLVFSRTGGGGDRPLIDRGRRAIAGGDPIEKGPARELARAGFAGISIDGPHGGPLRNPNNQDEQFLIFNFLDPRALRDNVLQSALELILTARMLEEIEIDASECPGVQGVARFDGEHVALMGHSMGATIAPLAAAFEPRYRALILSGAGASWIENMVHKEKPIAVRPLAERLLDYTSRGRTLDEFDPVLTIVQWAIEPADPQVYAARVSEAPDRHILMLQGIVDHYIMPPIANALSLALGLDLAGASLDRENAETARFRSLESMLPLVGRNTLTLPASANRDGATRIVVQNREDGIEDGHEVVFQTEAPKMSYRCFLETFARGAPRIPAPDAGSCR